MSLSQSEGQTPIGTKLVANRSRVLLTVEGRTVAESMLEHHSESKLGLQKGWD